MKKTFVKILNVATGLVMIDGIKRLINFNQGKHTENPSIIIAFMNIFAQQVVVFNGYRLILKVSLTIGERGKKS